MREILKDDVVQVSGGISCKGIAAVITVAIGQVTVQSVVNSLAIGVATEFVKGAFRDAREGIESTKIFRNWNTS